MGGGCPGASPGLAGACDASGSGRAVELAGCSGRWGAGVVELAGDASGSGRSAELAGCSGPWGADVVELAEGSACVAELAGLATG